MKQRSQLVLSSAALMLMLWLGGCTTTEDEAYFRDAHSRANVYVASVPSRIHKVAIMPFKAQTELIGIAASDLFVTEMLRAGRYELVERSQMAKVLSESELALAGLSATRAAEIGHMLGAEGVIIGTVDEYATVAQGGHSYPIVGISVRLIDCTSGKVMWSSDLAKRADSKATTLPEQARNVTHEIVAGLYMRWHVQPMVAVATRQSDREAAPLPNALVTRDDTTTGRTAESAGATGTTLLAPPEFKVSDMGLREVALTWAAPPARGLMYRIERATAAKGPFSVVATVAAEKREHHDTGASGKPLQDNMAYYYRLVALSDRVEGVPSPAKESLTAPPPEPPPAVKAEASGPRKLIVAWAASPSEGVTRYAIERATAEQPEKFTKRAETSDTSLEEGGTEKTDLRDSTTYLYRISSINRVGSIGAPGPAVKVTTQPPPAPPASVFAEAFASRAVRVAWKPSTAEWVTKYIVERTTSAAPDQFKKIAEAKGIKFEEGGTAQTDLRDSTKYLYRVTAINRLGAVGPPSAPVEVTTRPPPAVVQDFAAKSAEVRCVPLTWVPSPEPDVVCYDILRRDAPDRAFEKIGRVEGRTKTSFLDGGGDPGNLGDTREYEYQIHAINAVSAESADSAIVKATTRDAPPAVTGLKAAGNHPREVPLAWTTSPDEKVIGYEVLRLAPGEKIFTNIGSVAGRDTTTFTDRGGARKGLGRLLDKTEYRYQVVAFNTAHVRSAPSEMVPAVTKPVPATPREVTTTTNVPKAIRLAWRANPESDIACYIVEATANSGSRFREMVRIHAGADERLTAVESSLGDGEARCYRVKTVDRDGLESAWCDVVTGTARPLPIAPKGLAAQWQEQRLALTWTASPSPDIKNYRVWRKCLFTSELLATVESNACMLTAEQVGKKICVTISAVDAEQLESAASAPLDIESPAVK